MPFTKENRPFIEEAASINFQFMKNGAIAYRKHTKHELGIYFIKQAVEKHGHIYGYGEVAYINNSNKVKILCSKHGYFEQAPAKHLAGQRCPQCAKVSMTSTTETFINKANEVHNYRYDYSQVQYVGVSQEVYIICKDHGGFWQTPNTHLRGSGCKKCADESKAFSTEDFINKAITMHGMKYDYSKSKYRNMKEPISIICRIHGVFEQMPHVHLRGSGCKKCADDSLRFSTELFINRANAIHSGKYSYELVKYLGAHERVEITCPKHGSFWQSANAHLIGQGCPKCSDSLKHTKQSFVEKVSHTHQNAYDYSLVDYLSNKSKVTILCPTHGPFEQTPDNHMRGQGCPACAGKNHNTLYLLKCKDTSWYKIGITGNLTQRLISIGGNIEEVHHVLLEEPRKHETILHKRYEKDREYNLCVKSGNTEFFSLTEEQVKEVIDYMDEVVNER